MTHTQALQQGGRGVLSPLERLRKPPSREGCDVWRIMHTERLDKIQDVE